MKQLDVMWPSRAQRFLSGNIWHVQFELPDFDKGVQWPYLYGLWQVLQCNRSPSRRQAPHTLVQRLADLSGIGIKMIQNVSDLDFEIQTTHARGSCWKDVLSCALDGRRPQRICSMEAELNVNQVAPHCSSLLPKIRSWELGEALPQYSSWERRRIIDYLRHHPALAALGTI